MRFVHRALALSLLFGSLAVAQAPAPDAATSTYTPHMTFDVVSIHESRGVGMSFTNSRPKTSYFHSERVTPMTLLVYAYDLDSLDLLENVPEWAKTTFYDVTAKSDASADEALAKLSDKDSGTEQDHMLGAMLADRFKLKIHPEVRASTVYELLTTPRTAKLMTPFHGDTAQTLNTCRPIPSTAGQEMDSKGCPFSFLLTSLRTALGSTVVDHTGLSGMYTFDIKWGSSKAPEGEDTYPNILFAIREQLGLEVKQAKGTITVWVVDHIERPTPN